MKSGIKSGGLMPEEALTSLSYICRIR